MPWVTPLLEVPLGRALVTPDEQAAYEARVKEARARLREVCERVGREPLAPLD